MRCFSFAGSWTAIALAGIFTTASLCIAAESFTMDSARAAADNGDPQAEFFLARHYADGLGVSRDYTKAVEFLRQAAEKGYAPAQAGLGSCYARGEGVEQDYAEAVRWYRKAAKAGNAMGQYCLGYAYAEGKGAPKSMNEAIAWWKKSGDQGQVLAQNALGDIYLHGRYPADTNFISCAEAARWFRKAAEQNYAPAMGSLGYMYLYGLGVERDWSQALLWNRRGAEMGDATAQDNLGQMYENGNAGLPHDLVQAFKWYWLSDQQGNPAGRHDVIVIELHHALTEQQMAEAKRLAAEFRPQLHTNPPTANLEGQTESSR